MSDAKTELQNLIAKHEILNDLTLSEDELFLYLCSSKDNFVSAIVVQLIVNAPFIHSSCYGINYNKDSLTFNFVKHAEQ